jgi:hypothetical protein
LVCDRIWLSSEPTTRQRTVRASGIMDMRFTVSITSSTEKPRYRITCAAGREFDLKIDAGPYIQLSVVEASPPRRTAQLVAACDPRS